MKINSLLSWDISTCHHIKSFRREATQTQPLHWPLMNIQLGLITIWYSTPRVKHICLKPIEVCYFNASEWPSLYSNLHNHEQLNNRWNSWGLIQRSNITSYLFTTTPDWFRGSCSLLSSEYQEIFPWDKISHIMKLTIHLFFKNIVKSQFNGPFKVFLNSKFNFYDPKSIKWALNYLHLRLSSL